MTEDKRFFDVEETERKRTMQAKDEAMKRTDAISFLGTKKIVKQVR